MGDGGKEPDGEWAIDLLTGGMSYKTQFYRTYQGQIYFGLLGFLGSVTANVLAKRPPFSHLPRIIFGILMGTTFGHIVSWNVQWRSDRYDAVLVDYVRQYPDRFPAPENKKYADILQPWKPAR